MKKTTKRREREVNTGSREENATKQELGAVSRFGENGKRSTGLWDWVFFKWPFPFRPIRRFVSHVAFLIIDIWLRAAKRDHVTELWSALPEIEGHLPTETEHGLVLLAFGDPVFVRRFAPTLVESVARNSPSTHVHLHVFGRSGHGLPDILPNRQKVSVTWEGCNHGAMSAAERVRHYQSMRFVRLAQLLDRSTRPFLAIDIDSMVQHDINAQHHLWNGADIGLIRRNERFDPGKKILAAAVYAAPTEPARRFFHAVAARLLPHLAGAPYTEKLDQRCLYYTLCHDSTGVRVASLPMSLAALSADEALILSFRGRRKERHPNASPVEVPAASA